MARIIDFDCKRRRARRARRERPWRGVATMLVGGVCAGLALAMLPDAVRPGAAVAGEPVSAYFPLCGRGPRVTCVVDGDTIWLDGVNIRILGIDTPETWESQCEAEAALGKRAMLRMQELLNAGPITVVASGRDEDRYERKLRRIERDGVSLGNTLVREGLARSARGVVLRTAKQPRS